MSSPKSIDLPDINDTLANTVPLGWSWNGEFHWLPGICGRHMCPAIECDHVIEVVELPFVAPDFGEYLISGQLYTLGKGTRIDERLLPCLDPLRGIGLKRRTYHPQPEDVFWAAEIITGCNPRDFCRERPFITSRRLAIHGLHELCDLSGESISRLMGYADASGVWHHLQHPPEWATLRFMIQLISRRLEQQ